MNCPANCIAGEVVVDREFPVPTTVICGAGCPEGKVRAAHAAGDHAAVAKIYADARNHRDQLFDGIDDAENLAQREDRAARYEAAHADVLALASLIRKLTGRRPPAPAPAEVLTTPPAFFSTPTQPEE